MGIGDGAREARECRIAVHPTAGNFKRQGNWKNRRAAMPLASF
jgi:hypothetical protein